MNSKHGMEELVNETVFKTNVEIVRKVMKNFNVSVQQALKVLEIPESEYARYIAAI